MRNIIGENFIHELEDYLRDSKSAAKISKDEAIRRKAIPVTRDFTIENGDLQSCGDKYGVLGLCALNIEDVFTSMFFQNKIMYFTGYEMTELPETFGFKFRVETLVVQAKDDEWY